MFDGRGDAYLVISGIAKLLQSSQVLTTHTALLGTPSLYGAGTVDGSRPDARRRSIRARDLTYQPLTGELPF
ncbi:MAG: hypothetical protein IPK17_20255 [Chloroflexi bacterium]|uniref:hypothetical protein n=1 Tax=Candidatus Flexifilum breve TaxID=3140694 RepID=UPI003134BB36|nr:hypothetical protein [Chloroflexota bacterium]